MAIISRRGILRGLFAAPAIIAASSLMPIRGVAMLAAESEPIFRFYSGYDVLSITPSDLFAIPRPDFILASNFVINEMKSLVSITRAE